MATAYHRPALDQLGTELAIDADGWFAEGESDRLTGALQRSDVTSVQAYINRAMFSSIESRAMLLAHEGINREEGDRDGDALIELHERIIYLMTAATTPREHAMVNYADAAILCS